MSFVRLNEDAIVKATDEERELIMRRSVFSEGCMLPLHPDIIHLLLKDDALFFCELPVL